jgi:maltoporin
MDNGQLMTSNSQSSSSNSLLPAGYKQNEVGVIPEDWEVDRLGNCLFARPDIRIYAATITTNSRAASNCQGFE